MIFGHSPPTHATPEKTVQEADTVSHQMRNLHVPLHACTTHAISSTYMRVCWTMVAIVTATGPKSKSSMYVCMWATNKKRERKASSKRKVYGCRTRAEQNTGHLHVRRYVLDVPLCAREPPMQLQRATAPLSIGCLLRGMNGAGATAKRSSREESPM